MTFNNQLKHYRQSAQLTQESLAEKLFITVRTLQFYEQGAREPSLETLIRIAEILNITTDELLGRTQKE